MLNVSTHSSDFQNISNFLVLRPGVSPETTHMQCVLSQISSSVLHLTNEITNFVQVQNIIINVKDLVFTFIYAFVCYFCRFCLWLARKLKIIENACLLIPLTYNLATWYSVESLTSVQ